MISYPAGLEHRDQRVSTRAHLVRFTFHAQRPLRQTSVWGRLHLRSPAYPTPRISIIRRDDCLILAIHDTTHLPSRVCPRRRTNRRLPSPPCIDIPSDPSLGSDSQALLGCHMDSDRQRRAEPISLRAAQIAWTLCARCASPAGWVAMDVCVHMYLLAHSAYSSAADRVSHLLLQGPDAVSRPWASRLLHTIGWAGGRGPQARVDVLLEGR